MGHGVVIVSSSTVGLGRGRAGRRSPGLALGAGRSSRRGGGGLLLRCCGSYQQKQRGHSYTLFHEILTTRACVQTLDAKALRRVRLYFTRKPGRMLRKVKQHRVKQPAIWTRPSGIEE